MYLNNNIINRLRLQYEINNRLKDRLTNGEGKHREETWAYNFYKFVIANLH